MQNLIENLVWTLLHHQSNKRSINQITMGLLFLQLMNYTERVQVGEQYFEQEMLLGVYRYIEEHYREGSLSELAEELHYDFYTLSRLIRRLTGKTTLNLSRTNASPRPRICWKRQDFPWQTSVSGSGMRI